ncbi:hypothetical protein DL93DRAFT_2077999 [Clavulina sp. PMI_390]|nr:hypothetical protein DL93DRAFT_2077999 [Clavulina sp. PMI_390]
MLYAWVFDTLRLRQTCRLFRDISYQRVLWCKFLRQSCRLHGVPPVTYTLSDMSSAEVEAAVTRPYQFEDRLSFDWGERAYTTNTIGLSTAQLNDNGDTNPPKWDASLDDVVETTTLVRGGRFLIGVHNETWLACWDLWGTSPTSVSGKSHEKRLVSEPLGIYPCKGKVTRIVTQQSANDDNELIIGVFYQPASGYVVTPYTAMSARNLMSSCFYYQ